MRWFPQELSFGEIELEIEEANSLQSIFIVEISFLKQAARGIHERLFCSHCWRKKQQRANSITREDKIF